MQYWKRIDLTKEHLLPTAANVPVSATFWGFKKNVSDIRSFQFAATKASSNVACNRESDSKPLGQIHVVIYEAMVAGGTFKNKCGDHQVPTDQSIPEGKKFWEQASLSTSGGRTTSYWSLLFRARKPFFSFRREPDSRVWMPQPACLPSRSS